MFQSIRFSFLAALIAVTGSAWAQDYTVRMTADGGTATTYVARNAMRKTEPAKDIDVIYRFSDERIIHVDNSHKSFSEATFAQARAANAKLVSAAGARQQEMMRRIGMLAPPTVTKLGAGEKVAGYATERYLVKSPMMEMEVWAAPALTVPAAFYEMLISNAGQAAPFGGAVQFAEVAQEIDGMIMKQVMRMKGSGMTVTRVATSVDRAPIPASTFEPPAGYRRVDREP